MKISVIIAAAGNSLRLGQDNSISKQFVLLEGKPLLFYSLEKFFLLDDLFEIIIVTNDIESTNELMKKFKSKGNINIKTVLGGKLRQDSVYNGFVNLDKQTNIVVIHDVARPLFELSDVKKCIEIALDNNNAILAVPVVDTLKKICDEKSNNDRLVVEKTISREGLYAVQTPQVFSYQLLESVYKTYKARSSESINTDEAMMLEASGKTVNLVQGSRTNIKITYPEDIELAKALLNGSEKIENKDLELNTEVRNSEKKACSL